MKTEIRRETAVVATPAGRVQVSLMAYDRVEVYAPRHLRVSGRRIDCSFVLARTVRGWEVDPELSGFRDSEGRQVPAAIRARLLRLVEPAALEWVHCQPRSAWDRANRFWFQTNKRGFIAYDLSHLASALQDSSQVFGGFVRDRCFGSSDGMYASLRKVAGRCRDLLEEVNALKPKAAKITYARVMTDEPLRAIRDLQNC